MHPIFLGQGLRFFSTVDTLEVQARKYLYGLKSREESSRRKWDLNCEELILKKGERENVKVGVGEYYMQRYRNGNKSAFSGRW